MKATELVFVDRIDVAAESIRDPKGLGRIPSTKGLFDPVPIACFCRLLVIPNSACPRSLHNALSLAAFWDALPFWILLELRIRSRSFSSSDAFRVIQ